jgi:hypothetical protein
VREFKYSIATSNASRRNACPSAFTVSDAAGDPATDNRIAFTGERERGCSRFDADD